LEFGEVRDAIHGNIEFDETECKIINTPEMQRLRYIKQLDMAYLVFPGANHCRFEHSLGSMRVAKELVSHIYGDGEKELSYVGLLHDIGHGPFSHLSEFVMEKYLKKNHEQIGEEVLVSSGIKDILEESGLSFRKIVDYFRDSKKVDLVGGALGSDRIDYLMRDSHYTGVAYGIIDYERLKGRLVPSNGRVAITDAGVSGAESLLIARYFMHSNVYMHHAKLIAAKMMQNAISASLEAGEVRADELISMTDNNLVGALLASKEKPVHETIKRIMDRCLFKRAYYEGISKNIDTEELECAIEDAGFSREDFVVYVRSFKGENDDIEVVDRDGSRIGMLTELSPLIKTLTGVLAGSKKLLVACDRKNVDRINPIVKKFLG
jgi:HD superfamily phosphohydrolase